eukprot:jgi/Chrzof1/13232/Cz07g25170.t1
MASYAECVHNVCQTAAVCVRWSRTRATITSMRHSSSTIRSRIADRQLSKSSSCLLASDNNCSNHKQTCSSVYQMKP